MINGSWKIIDDLISINKKPKAVYDDIPVTYSRFAEWERTRKETLARIQQGNTIYATAVSYTLEEYILNLSTFEDFKITPLAFHVLDSPNILDLSGTVNDIKIRAMMIALICSLITEKNSMKEALKKQLIYDCNVSPDCLKRSIEKIVEAKGKEIQKAFDIYNKQKSVMASEHFNCLSASEESKLNSIISFSSADDLPF